MDIMVAVSCREGISPDELAAIQQFETSPLFDEMDRLVLHYATEMTKTPVEVPGELFAELQLHFSDKQLIELTAVIAFENFRARLDHAFGIESGKFADAASCHVPGNADNAA